MNLQRDEQHAAQLRFAEQMGLYFERYGLPPMGGRILGWLLLSDPPQQSSRDLVEVLNASKGSISTNTRMLMQAGLIRRTAVTGQRGAYFEVEPDAWVEMLEHKLAALTDMRAMLESGLALIPEDQPERRARLEDITFVYGFFESEWPQMMARVREAREAHRLGSPKSKEDRCAD
ncbi:MAG: MarR family transcriptional regulator [Alphaproteobacteria bacterium]|nr:MarR family transcriptional regulator [Alphaproteobacteria bacterium]